MHQKLASLLDAKGIKNLADLSPEEKADFDRWNSILSEGELTLEKVQEFCGAQRRLIEARWRSLEVSEQRKAELIPYHTVYSALLELLTAPRAERENLEKYLDAMSKT